MQILSGIGVILGRFAARLAARHRAATEDPPAPSSWFKHPALTNSDGSGSSGTDGVIGVSPGVMRWLLLSG